MGSVSARCSRARRLSVDSWAAVTTPRCRRSRRRVLCCAARCDGSAAAPEPRRVNAERVEPRLRLGVLDALQSVDLAVDAVELEGEFGDLSGRVAHEVLELVAGKALVDHRFIQEGLALGWLRRASRAARCCSASSTVCGPGRRLEQDGGAGLVAVERGCVDVGEVNHPVASCAVEPASRHVLDDPEAAEAEVGAREARGGSGSSPRRCTAAGATRGELLRAPRRCPPRNGS